MRKTPVKLPLPLDYDITHQLTRICFHVMEKSTTIYVKIKSCNKSAHKLGESYIKKSILPPSGFVACAWLKRQIDCAAPESNYFWKAVLWRCFFLICICQCASWGTLALKGNMSSPKVWEIKKNNKSHKFDSKIWSVHERNCYSNIQINISEQNVGQIALIKSTEGDSCEHKRNPWS